MNKVIWTKEDEIFIKENHGKLTLPQMRAKLNKYGITYSGFRSKCQRLGFYRDRAKTRIPWKNHHNQEYWREPTLINCYMAGLVASDGCIKQGKNGIGFSYQCAIKDESIINLWKKELCYDGAVSVSVTKSPHSDNLSTLKSIQISCFDKNAGYLKHWFNLVPNKTFRLGPTNLQDKNLNLPFLIGVIDGDGSIEYSKIRNGMAISFNSASKKFIEWIKEAIDKEFPPISSRTANVSQHSKDKYYRFYLYGVRAAIVFDYLSKFPVPKLERKWQNSEVLDYVAKCKQNHPDLFSVN